MDIILHCLDPSQLKNKGLQDVFPAVCRFNQVSHCPATRRIAGKKLYTLYTAFEFVHFIKLNWAFISIVLAVGSNAGTLTMYELRQGKCTTINAHGSPVTAAAFSPDGKFLVSYACGENKLCFWQTSTGKPRDFSVRRA